MQAPQALPVKIDHPVAAAGGQLGFLGQGGHGRGAAAEARQDADLHRHAPAARLHQGRLVEVLLEPLQRVGVVLHHQVVDQLPQGPELPVLQPVVVGKAKGPGREADQGARALQLAAHFPQQSGELLAPPAHPGPLGVVIGRFEARFGEVAGTAERVIAQLHRPGEMVVELDTVNVATLHDLADQAEEALPHPRVGGVEPHHRLAVHSHLAAAVAALQHPVGMLGHHRGIGRLHQAIFKPGNHLEPAPVGGLGEATDWIEIGVGLGQGRLHRRMAGAVEGGSPAPHIRVEGVEARIGQLPHRPVDPGGVVIEGAGAIGEPNADAPGWGRLALGQQGEGSQGPGQGEQHAHRSWQEGL